MNLNGTNVIISQFCVVPKMQISKECAAILDKQVLDSMNAWMRDFFGTKEESFQITDPITRERKFVVGPKTYELLRNVP